MDTLPAETFALPMPVGDGRVLLARRGVTLGEVDALHVAGGECVGQLVHGVLGVRTEPGHAARS